MNVYKKDGIQLVTAMDSYHPTSDLAQHRNSIINEFQSRPPASAKEAAARIEQWTVVANDGDITATTVCEMLRKLSVQ
jgi:hypothetical protein